MKLINEKVVWTDNGPVLSDQGDRNNTISYRIIKNHNIGDEENLRIRFDSLISHDITYVGIIQTAKASGLEKFPIEYVLTNCHNSLCAVGGTINEDDHLFGLSAAKKYGGVYVPANQAVIHQYAREMMAGCGKMILGSDSHTRYGALGTMAIGEGGPELVKQLLSNTYDIAAPEVILVHVTGEVRKGVGPHDVALALCKEVYANGFVKNKIMEFAGEGIKTLPMDFRMGVDVMTTETACLSSVWQTDEAVKEYLTVHNRADEFDLLEVKENALYDGMIELKLDEIEPMIALPFHPSNAYTIREFKENMYEILKKTEEQCYKQFNGKAEMHLLDQIVDGNLVVSQGIIGGCAGGMFDNIAEVSAILGGSDIGNDEFNLSIYPPSQPVNIDLMKAGYTQKLIESGVVFKPCFCGPCFGAGDTPGNNGISIRHTTRNFPNREGSKPAEGQASVVMLMDGRSIAATARNHGILTAATEIEYQQPEEVKQSFNDSIYQKRCYYGFEKADESVSLKLGPNITEWPDFEHLKDNLLMRLAAVIHDPVTTTDELIPSGETSSFRSNPIRLSQFALSRRCPDYLGKANEIAQARDDVNKGIISEKIKEVCQKADISVDTLKDTSIGSVIFANMPGDGSAREQAASCQRVLGGSANICYQYATKRYRSNCINWGMLPFNIDKSVPFDYSTDDYIYVKGIKEALLNNVKDIEALVIGKDFVDTITLHLPELTDEEVEILLDGCLMNYYAAHKN